jgi:excisionase family DNA binding protein
MMEKATLTVAETAQYIGLGLNKTYQLVNEKVIPSIKLGRQYKIPKVALDEWLLTKSKEVA